MSLRLCIFCYGADYASLFEKVALRSLLQPRNRTAIPSDVTVSLYSDAETMPAMERMVRQLGGVIECHPIQPSDNYTAQSAAFADEIGRCVKEDAGLVIVNPDCFWGNGSLGNLLAIAGEQNVCVAVPHPRVEREAFLAELPDESLDNPALVSLSMKTLHQSWKDADADGVNVNTWHTGISIRSAGNLHVVSHLQPTVFFARPTARDYGYFAERKAIPGLWDHHWPEILAQEQRLRVIASSDAVFIAELTEAHTHTTPLKPTERGDLSTYHRDAAHVRMNRGIVSVWREG